MPIAEDVVVRPMARPPSPLQARGYPSRAVAAEAAVPGILIRMDAYQSFWENRVEKIESELGTVQLYRGYKDYFTDKNTWFLQRWSSNRMGIILSGLFALLWLLYIFIY